MAVVARSFILVLFAFSGEATPSCAQGLLLTLCSGVTPGSAEGAIWEAKDGTQVGCRQGNARPHFHFILYRNGKLSQRSVLHVERKIEKRFLKDILLSLENEMKRTLANQSSSVVSASP